MFYYFLESFRIHFLWNFSSPQKCPRPLHGSCCALSPVLLLENEFKVVCLKLEQLEQNLSRNLNPEKNPSLLSGVLC